MLPLLPPILYGVASGLVIYAIMLAALWKKTTPIEGKSLCVLGPQGAGKTTLYCLLQNKTYKSENEATNVDDYPPFFAKIGNEIYRIKGGRDIGGGEEYIKIYYDNFIGKNDVIFFIFNINLYLDDEEYAKRMVRDRLDYIYRKLRERYDNEKSESEFEEWIKSRYVLLASHIDQIPMKKRKYAIDKLRNSVQGKEFGSMFINNLIPVDLTDRADFMKIIEKKQIYFHEDDFVDSK